MTPKVKVIISIVVIAASVAAGRFTTPTKVVEKEHIVYQDKIVEKIVYKKEESSSTQKVTVKFVKILPDGTKTIETKTYYSNQIEVVQNQTSDVNKETHTDVTKEKTVENQKGDWLISAGVKTDLNLQLSYGAFVNRRILGPIYLGAFGFTDKTFGLSAGLIF